MTCRAGGSGDQQVAARPEAAPDLGDECRRMRDVLQQEDCEYASQRRVSELTDGPFDRFTMLRLVASPRPGRALRSYLKRENRRGQASAATRRARLPALTLRRSAVGEGSRAPIQLR